MIRKLHFNPQITRLFIIYDILNLIEADAILSHLISMALESSGLANVVAGETAVSFVDGKKGVLVYHGHRIEDLIKQRSFEEVIHLLLFGSLPNKEKRQQLNQKLIKERYIPDEIIGLIQSEVHKADPMSILRTSVSLLSKYDEIGDRDIDVKNLKPEINVAIKLIAKIPTITAYMHRLLNHKDIVEPRKDFGHAENFLYMLHGQKPTTIHRKAMDIALTVHADHTFNASTFAGRICAATLSDMYSAITAAIATLKGPLHGGANRRVIDMIDEIKTIKNAKKYVLHKLENHERIMGMGHRVYKTEDPRSRILMKYAQNLTRNTPFTIQYAILEKVREVFLGEMKKKRKPELQPNVDFYSGLCYRALGIDKRLFTPIFACGRIAGWCAHVLEQYSDNRLIRPKSTYIGPQPTRGGGK